MKPLEEMGKFKTVVIDPPWDIDKGPNLRNNGLNDDLPYGLLTTAEIGALPVHAVLDNDAFLFCWTVNKRLENAHQLLRHWGAPHAFTMTWIKNGGPQFPNGPMHNAEWCIVGKRGQPQFQDTKAFFTANYWPRGAHSEKPEGFYDLLRRVTPSPRLDIFGRRRIAGFYSWGDEAPEGEPDPDHYQMVMA